jgi:hypothetical protein
VDLGDYAHDVGFLHDQELFALNLHLGARPFAEQDAVADLEIDRNELPGLVAAARADGDDLTLRGLLLRGVRDYYAALGLLLGGDAAHDHAVMQRAKLRFGHIFSS